MSSDLIRLAFQLPEISPDTLKIAAIAAGGVLFLALLVILLVARGRRKRSRDEDFRGELVAMERETQFAAAAEQSQYLKSSLGVARDMESILRDYLFMTTFAIYAGREGSDNISDVLYGGRTDEHLSSGMVKLPDSLPVSMLREYTGPQVASLAALSGMQIPPEDEEWVWEEEDGAAQQEGQTSEDDPMATGPLSVERSRESEADMPGIDPSSPVMVLPWRGPFGWRGLIVTRSREAISGDALARYQEPLSRLGEKLSVALELEHQQRGLLSASEGASRAIAFSRNLIVALDAPSPLESIAKETAALLSASSAALWRAEPDESLFKMVAAYGLRSREFLPLPAGQGLAGSVAKSGSPLALEDAPSDPRCLFPREAKESGIHSYLGAPLIAGERTLGVIEAHTASPRSWTKSDMSLLESAASLIAQAMDSSEQRGDRFKSESAYLGLSEAMQQLRSPREIVEAAVEVLGHALEVSRAVLVEFGEGGQPAPVKDEYCSPDVKSAVGATFSKVLFQRISSAMAANQVLAISDSTERSFMNIEMVSALGVLSEFIVPIRFEGQTRAIIYLHQCDRKREWRSEEMEFADRLSRQMTLSLTNLRALEAALRNVEAARKAEAAARSVAEQAHAALEQAQALALQERAAAQQAQAEVEQARSAIEQAQALALQERASAQQARAEVEQARAEAQQAIAAAQQAQAATATSHRDDGEMQKEIDRLREDEARVRRSAQQLLEINRLKSDFIVNAGHELEASLQSVMGFADLLNQGSYGPLSVEQEQAVRSLYAWARRMKNDVDWIIEYGSTRSRRLEQSDESDATQASQKGQTAS